MVKLERKKIEKYTYVPTSLRKLGREELRALHTFADKGDGGIKNLLKFCLCG